MSNILNKIKGSIKAELAKKLGASNQTTGYPADFSAQEISAIEKVSDFTMTSHERLVTLFRAVDYIEENKIEGDIVECGVWRGGSTMLVANRLKDHHNEQRALYLFDTFEGMSEPSELDVSYDEQQADTLLKAVDKVAEGGNNIWCYASIEDVQSNLKSTGYTSEKMHFIKGKVEETLPTVSIDKIAILRLDTDWYESTRAELEHLYHKLSVGGILIIDDYGHWQGARKAVDEFIKENNIRIFLNRIDYTGRLGVKIE